VASSEHALVAPVPDGRGSVVAWEVRAPDSSGRVEASLVRFDPAGDRTTLRSESAVFSARSIRPGSIAVECGGTTCVVARELAGGNLSLETLEGAPMTALSDPAARARFAVDASGSEAVFTADDAIVRVDLESFAIAGSRSTTA
jgi:hypothetical protein